MFFFLGMSQLVLASLWWALVLLGRTVPALALPAALAPSLAHATMMSASFLALFMFGFLFTAGPRWLSVDPLPESVWQWPAALGGIALLLFWPLALASEPAARAALAVHGLVWAWFALRFAGLIGASRVEDKAHATMIAAAMFAGALVPLGVAAAGTSAYTLVRPVAIWGFLLPVFASVCHRMIPFFTASALPMFAIYRPRWLFAVMLAPAPVHLVCELAGLGAWTWIVDLPVGLGMLVLVFRWGLVASLGVRLLAMLHLGFAWYGVALLLFGAQSLALLFGRSILGLAPLHALTTGFFTAIAVAMVTRVTLGHSGRPLAAGGSQWTLYLLVHVAAIMRVASDLAGNAALLAATAALWFATLGAWCAINLPVYLRPRADGRPG